MENKKINELLDNEQQSRNSQNFRECLGICIRILNLISTNNEDSIFDIISKLFLYKNQSNFVRIGIIFHLINNNYLNINDNKNLKRKYYQLLIDSFSKDSIHDKKDLKKNIIKFFEVSELKNFKNIDDYILSLENIFINEKTNSSDRDLFDSSEKEKNNINFEGKQNLEEDLIPEESQQNQISQIGLVEDLNSKQLGLTKFLSENKVILNNKNSIRQYKVNNKLPMIIISVSVNLNSNDFVKLVNSTFIKLNYRNICNVKNSYYDNVDIYEYNPKNIFENIIYCLSNKRVFIKNIFQVVSILKKDDNNFSSGINYFLNDNYERKISIKTVRGNEKNVINFIIKFLKLFSSSVNKIKIIKQSKNFFKYNLEQILNEQIQKRKNMLLKSVNLPKKKQQNLYEQETLVEISNKKANLYYDIYKILSNTEYELGKSVYDFIENFKIKYKEIVSPNSDESIENINTKPLIIQIVKMVELSTNTLNCNFNSFNINYNSSFFSAATEQFIFSRIYHLLYDIYDKKYKKENEEYITIKKDINENMSPYDIMANVGIKEKYRGKESLPYKNVIENINKITLEKSLKNKFEILTQSSLEMRNYILEYTSGKNELESMDDELPIIIYISTQVKIENLIAELNMIDDYIKSAMRDELIQNKMVTNLLSSLLYIRKSWDIKLKTFTT